MKQGCIKIRFPGQYSNPSLNSDPGHILVPGLRLGSNLELVSSSLSLELVTRSSGSLQVTGLDSGHGSSPVEFLPSPVQVLGENLGFAGDGSTQGDALLLDPDFSVPFSLQLGFHSPAVASLPSSQVCTSFLTILLSDGAAVMETRKVCGSPINSFVSTSQLWYTRRVKEKVAKQLNKNKDLIAEAVVDIPVVGEGRVFDAMNLGSVVGLSWGGEDKKLRDMLIVIDEPVVEASAPKVKGMRELKNLDCSISPVKGPRQWGFLGSKKCIFFFPRGALGFPLKCTRVPFDRVFGWVPCFRSLCRSWGVGFFGFSLVLRGCIGFCFGGFLGYPLYTLCVLGGALRSF